MSAITKLVSKAAGVDIPEDVDLVGLVAGTTAMQGDIARMADLLEELVRIERARAEHDGIKVPPRRNGVVKSLSKA
jgi:hypothetical protein